MSNCNALLEIQVHLEDGRISRFEQNDPALVRTLLAHIQPTKLFAQPHIVLRDDKAMTLFPCTTIVRIDLIAPNVPEWPFYRGVKNVQEITREEFQKLSAPKKDPRSPLVYAGDSETDYAEIETVSGQLIYLQLEVRREPVTAIDRHMLLQQLLALGGLHWRRHDGGTSILNTAKIARLAMSPGPSAPAGAWPASRLLG
ncbi:MAG: hypothetical protein JWN14_1415 [Chthonomonadales bacterium]|nr:hypothetical protein [Chthonomonadales bacterium]